MLYGKFIIEDFLYITQGARFDVSPEFSLYLITFISYSLGTIALLTLFCMLRFISNLEKDQVFIRQNVKWLRFISYGCLTAGILLFVVSLVYIKFFIIISLAALFMMLIVRVIKNAFEQAVEMKEELDLTI